MMSRYCNRDKTRLMLFLSYFLRYESMDDKTFWDCIANAREKKGI